MQLLYFILVFFLSFFFFFFFFFFFLYFESQIFTIHREFIQIFHFSVYRLNKFLQLFARIHSTVEIHQAKFLSPKIILNYQQISNATRVTVFEHLIFFKLNCNYTRINKQM
eukprot:TRINITY_DN3089_c0_g3_i1.p1 TRINITY_DN3089_c0_g3~~TRINITY_DN3089_c0_g3_i1.p1  ORF type:complete len:118 (-),score=2.11 TRINITY_DN3089_c0_g3_i1:111-443(-)